MNQQRAPHHSCKRSCRLCLHTAGTERYCSQENLSLVSDDEAAEDIKHPAIPFYFDGVSIPDKFDENNDSPSSDNGDTRLAGSATPVYFRPNRYLMAIYPEDETARAERTGPSVAGASA